MPELVKARWKPLYEAVSAGATTYLHSLGDPERVGLAQTRDALASVGPLAVKINPHFGLRYDDDGRREAVRLHFDEDPPTPEAITATLHLMARHMDQILPNAEPVLVDLRRGVTHRMDPAAKPGDIESWLAGEAAAFTAIMWAAPPPDPAPLRAGRCQLLPPPQRPRGSPPLRGKHRPRSGSPSDEPPKRVAEHGAR